MASITTVISFFILLLATFSYSAPIGKEFENSTPDYEFTTNPTIVEREVKFPMPSESSEETTIVPIQHKDRSSEETHSDEVTTEDETRSVRGFTDDQFPTTTEINEKRTVEDFLLTTLESSAEFNRRAIRPVESEEIMESSTSIDSEKQIEMTTDVEPSSSVNLFGKYTGLLTDEPITTPEYEPTEESTKRLPVKSQQLTKTVSIIPGKITETKIYANLPSKTSVVIEPVETEQLSEVQDKSNIKKTKSDN